MVFPFLLLTVSAGAAEPLAAPSTPVEPGGFEVQRADASVVVREVGVPKGIGIHPKLRTCRVSVRWEGGRWRPEIRPGCHPNLAEEVAAAAERWVLEVTPPARDRELFEYWYVFPTEDGGPVRVFVRQAHDQELAIRDERIRMLEWSVEGFVFPEYPAEAVGRDTERTRCEAKVDVAPSGTVGEVVIDGCDAVFRPGLETTLRRWRFGTPQLDDVPFDSGVTLGVQFHANVDDPTKPGEAKVLFPPDADLGARTRRREDRSFIAETEPNPIPEGPRLFLVDHKSYAEIGVYEMVWPEVAPADRERTCDVLFQVNSKRHVLAWPEACDESVMDATVIAAQQWVLMHGRIEPYERYARFRGTFVFPAGGGHPELRIPADDLETPERTLPEHVHTYVEPQAIRTIPPRLPEAFASEVLDPIVTCELDVTVDPRGRPAAVRTRRCPGAFREYAEEAVERWRWRPAASRGKAIASQVTVRIRFDQG